MLAATLPASTAAQDPRRQKRADGLRKKLAKIDVSERALVTELETPIDPPDPAAQALRNRVRARFTELYTERTSIETELATLETAPIEEDDLRARAGVHTWRARASDHTVSGKRDTREGGAAFPPRPEVRGFYAAILMRRTASPSGPAVRRVLGQEPS
jgi:hypothetical protein